MFLSGFMLVPVGFSIYYGDDDVIPILISAAITLAAGLLLHFIFRFDGEELRLKDSFAIVSLGWIFAALFGALPFFISGHIPCFTDAFFESMSGFTTTGATILTDIEALPHGVLFWRSLTHWIGGMGIIVLSLAILPLLKVGGMQLYKAEIPGPVPDKLAPRIQQTAKLLWGVYILLSLSETGLFLLGGMNLFDSLCHTFGTMATGGFSTKNASIAHFGSSYFHLIIIIFMFLAGTNFSLHYHGLRGRVSSYWKSEEFRAYLSFILVAFGIMTTINLLSLSSKWPATIKHSAFQVVSIITTTGFTTADFGEWHPAAQIILLFLMFFGGSAGSTGGSIKILRILILFKLVKTELKRLLHPKAVIPVRIDKRQIAPPVVINVLAFISLYFIIFASVTVIMSLMGLDLVSAMGSVAATLGNIGPGLGSVSPSGNYLHIPLSGKWLLSFCMMLGRLEIYTILVLFSKDFWK